MADGMAGTLTATESAPSAGFVLGRCKTETSSIVTDCIDRFLIPDAGQV